MGLFTIKFWDREIRTSGTCFKEKIAEVNFTSRSLALANVYVIFISFR